MLEANPVSSIYVCKVWFEKFIVAFHDSWSDYESFITGMLRGSIKKIVKY